MSRSRPLAAACLVALLALPIAAASWSVGAEREPSTLHDLLDGWMWHEADEDPDPAVRRVYFNAIPVSSLAPWGVSTDANHVPLGLGGVAANAAGSRLAPVGAISFLAYLGVWKDCNGDGFVGHRESALMEYRHELLGDDSVCPYGTEFNDHGWVFEFEWIGPRPEVVPRGPRQRMFFDETANVWGDFGRPGEAPDERCTLYPPPRGMLASTGALVSLADCQTGRRVAHTLSGIDPDGSRGLAFDDPDRPQDDCDHAANQPIGAFERGACDGDARAGLLEENSGDPAFTVWDCERRGEHRVADPTTSSGRRGYLSGGGIRLVGWLERDEDTLNLTIGHASGHAVYLPGVRIQGDGSGSAYDTLNHTETGLHDCANDVGVSRAAFLTWTDGIGGPDPLGDAKSRVDFQFRFHAMGHRDMSHTGRTTPTYLGVTAVEHAMGGGWRSREAYAPPHYRASTIRNDLQPDGPVWATLYATLDPGAARFPLLPPTGEGIYGYDWCGASTSGVHNGWNCDPRAWERYDREGEPIARTVVGQPFHLRDVDCLDGHLADGVDARLTLLSDEPPCDALPQD